MPLYNKAKNLPPHLVKRATKPNIALQFTRHAKEQCFHDRYGEIIPPTIVDVNAANIIEIETDDRDIVRKVVIRIPYSETHDLSMALLPEFGIESAWVKTVWLNDKNDNHASLKKELLA